MNNRPRLLAIWLAIMVSGCAHQPRQVEASRPLVSPQMNAQPALPGSVQQALDSFPQGATFNHHEITFMVGQRYISALGRECIELTYQRQSGHPHRSAACKDGENWYQVTQLEQATVGNLFAE
ncbi:hypothetical protein EHZ86_19720 [Aeromonas australiensis]|uniref:hypothetical protein n=1 Tax=Aeromonas australiensis TaxID=1114880 RepID=UPI001F2FE735|nr:hypothetical protein [Aeromonas australiensis]MCF3099435.1 hypothetical protein [Aeromonas australiensis]